MKGKAPSLPPWAADLKERALALTEEVTALRRDFHRHPELSHQEERTARVVTAYLQNLGLKVTTGLAGHGVMGLLDGPRPGRAVVYRADMDALPLTEAVPVPWRSQSPGVMHACGHDFHLAIALGAAKLLSQFRDRLAGQVRFIFQPAEEVPRDESSGARGMVAAGVLEHPRAAAVLALHVAPNLDAGHVQCGPEVVMAGAYRLTLTVTGKSAHGATPHKGVDPSWPRPRPLPKFRVSWPSGWTPATPWSSPSGASPAAAASTSWRIKWSWKGASATWRSAWAKTSWKG